jgi:hypothetical protein
MCCGTKIEGFAMQLDSLIEISWFSSLLEADENTVRKVTEYRGPIWMRWGTQSEGIAMKLDSLVEICCISSLLKASSKRSCKVIE